jgi:hypothetical protein
MVHSAELLNIESELSRITNCDFNSDFVAICNLVNDEGYCQHAGLIICYEKQVFFYHYTGRNVELNDITNSIDQYNSIYLKKLNIIVEDDVVSFLGHCEKLQVKGVNPQYGFVFNDSYYDTFNKDSFLINARHDITTCVGFCIKVIRGFLYNNTEYIKIDDWSNDSISNVANDLKVYIKKYLQKYAESQGITIDDLYKKSELKRILPSELLSSAFFENLPISKISIDQIRPTIEGFIVLDKVA